MWIKIDRATRRAHTEVRKKNRTDFRRRSAFLFRHDALFFLRSGTMLFALTFFPFNLALAWTGPFREEIEAVEAASDATKGPSRSSRQSKWCGVGQQHNNSGIIWWQSMLFLCCVDPFSHLSPEETIPLVHLTFSSLGLGHSAFGLKPWSDDFLHV